MQPSTQPSMQPSESRKVRFYGIFDVQRFATIIPAWLSFESGCILTHPNATECNPNATMTQPPTAENATLSLQNGNCIKVVVKVDDGVSGVSFDRPGVQRLLDDAKTGKINLILCKDLSRFGRNYIKSASLRTTYSRCTTSGLSRSRIT